jgi:hypothetical protein
VLSYRVRPRCRPRLRQPDWSSLQDPAVLLSDLLLAGVYPAVPWAAYLLTGLAVGRSRSTARRRPSGWSSPAPSLWAAPQRPARCCSARFGGYAALGGARRRHRHRGDRGSIGRLVFGNVPTDSWWFLAVDARHSSTTPDLVGTTGTALLALGCACS